MRVIDRWMGRVGLLVTMAVLGLAVYVGYRLAQANVRADVYRARLLALSEEHDALREQYNRAVQKTAVTELIVDGGKLSVVVVTPEHEVRRIETPFDPRGEIHVDFVVLEGRLWIRRIHDSDTPPAKALVIEPSLGKIDWDASGMRHGLAIYRPLGEGRWVVRVTGNGALTLKKAPHRDRTQLATGVRVDDFDAISDADADDRAEEVGVIDTLKALLSSS